MTEIKIFLYSMIDGSIIREEKITNQKEVIDDLIERKAKGEDVSIFEGLFFPTMNSSVKYDSQLRNFTAKTEYDLYKEGSRELQPNEKIVGNQIIQKSLFEMYNENLILRTFPNNFFKVSENNTFNRKNIKEILLTDTLSDDQKIESIKNTLTELMSRELSNRQTVNDIKYPNLERQYFGLKYTMAKEWITLTNQEKIEEIKRNIKFMILFITFSYDIETVDFLKLISDVDSLAKRIIEKNEEESEEFQTILKMRKSISEDIKKITTNEHTINKVILEINKINNDIFTINNIILSDRLYGFINFNPENIA